MSPSNFDFEALIRAFALSLAGGFTVGAIGYFVMRARSDWTQRKPVLIMGVMGLMLFLVVGVYYAWPNLVEVPELGGYAQAEAEDILAKRHLTAESRPQWANDLAPGRVVPHSQSPVRGLLVRPGTTVSFGVAVSPEGSPVEGVAGSAPAVSFFEPKPGTTVAFVRSGDGLYRCSARGTSSGFRTGFQLLLWLRPVEPPSDQFGAWYLQRSGNGVSVEPDGTWAGIAQLGNSQYPPQDGYKIDLAISVADQATASTLLGQSGVVIRDHPIGLQSAVVSNLIVKVH
ncbi:MAG TPA: hypothetical protein VI386_30940 [Candidatus Sulfotelmatobacter sp.]